MKLIFLLSSLVLFSNSIYCQHESDLNRTVFFELAGSGGLGSFNYEQVVLRKKNTLFLGRLGLSIAPIDKNNGTGLVLPLMVHALRGNKQHKLDIGLGQGLTFTTKGSVFLLTTAAIGYRYQPMERRIMFRASYTPLISYLVDVQVQHWFGFSIGYRLNRKKNNEE